jgi:hypothetical protein
MAIDCIDEIPGAAELRDWFGGFPSFHDADMEFVVKSDGTGWLRAFGARMTSRIDENGYFISDKHFAATFYFEDMLSASLTDFLPGMAILGRLVISREGEAFKMDFVDTSYGVSGFVIANKLRLEFEPGKRVR